jgi:hypothetical protein
VAESGEGESAGAEADVAESAEGESAGVESAGAENAGAVPARAESADAIDAPDAQGFAGVQDSVCPHSHCRQGTHGSSKGLSCIHHSLL